MDKIDVKIIECLKKNARENASVIGSQVNMSVSAVIERIKKLEANGIIKQYTVVLDSKKLGMDITAFISVSMEHPKYNNNFNEFVKTHKQITECHYITGDFDGTVQDLLYAKAYETVNSGFFNGEVIEPLGIKYLMDKQVANLSGGELQRVAITLCLATEADMYLFDEPSAYLDSNQRMNAAKTIRRMMEKTGRSAMIVDHDIYFLDMVSDSMMVFGGEPGHHGIGDGPFDMREGMNRFLDAVDITFRRDADTHRPRINKPDSRLDREQKSKGEYYYA